jgi:iron complex outermembrane receptor protein
VFLPAALSGGAGTITDQDGTGWDTLALKGTWRSNSGRGAHIVDFGFQQDQYRLRSLRSNIIGNWLADPAGTLNTRVGGDTQLQSLYAQDSWAFAAD